MYGNDNQEATWTIADYRLRLEAKDRQLNQAVTLIRKLLKDTGCDGDLCCESWHEQAREIIHDFDEPQN